MAIEGDRVVVMVNASREISLSGIGAALQGLPLKAGDKFIVVGVVHQVTNPMGYKSKVESGSILSVSHKFIKEELAKKKQDFLNNELLKQVSKQCTIRQIEFQIEVQAGPSPKVVAVTAARSFRATWLVLDRQMKKDKKYLMEKLSCGIARMRSNNHIQQLRAPPPPHQEAEAVDVGFIKSKSKSKTPYPSSSTSSSSRPTRRAPPLRFRATFVPVNITYGEMVEGSSDEGDLSTRATKSTPKCGGSGSGDPEAKPSWSFYSTTTTIRKSSSSDYLPTTVSTLIFGFPDSSRSSVSESKSSAAVLNLVDEEAEATSQGTQYSPSSGPDHDPVLNDWIGGPTEMFQNSVCSICNNVRPKIGWTRDFTFAELQAATGNFAEDNFLSEGGFGSVYRGEIDGLKIAVKQHKRSASFQGEKEFKSEVDVLSRARHENLVMLLGSYSERSQRLLVYEFVCNGSLDQHLSEGSDGLLTWEKRMKIAMGAARGLQYLHENNIIHRDMRPNNILVTEDFEPLLGDFGLAKTQLEDSDNSSDQTRVVGTLGYLAPEYAEFGKVSSKTDVYAFGVVLLQLITGKKTTDKNLGGRSLVGWARPLLKERNYPDLIDQRIIDSHDVHQLFWMVRVAEKCLSKDPHKRLPMNTVVLALSDVMEGKSVCGIEDFSPAHSSGGSVRGELTDSPGDDGDDHKTCMQSYCGGTSARLPPPSPSMQVLFSPSSAPEEESDEDYYHDYVI